MVTVVQQTTKDVQILDDREDGFDLIEGYQVTSEDYEVLAGKYISLLFLC